MHFAAFSNIAAGRAKAAFLPSLVTNLLASFRACVLRARNQLGKSLVGEPIYIIDKMKYDDVCRQYPNKTSGNTLCHLDRVANNFHIPSVIQSIHVTSNNINDPTVYIQLIHLDVSREPWLIN